MKIQAGHYYLTRGGRTVGPIEATPAIDDKAGSPEVWVWRTRDPNDGRWMHWKSDGRWYQAPGQESANDLVREAKDYHIAGAIIDGAIEERAQTIKDAMLEKPAAPMTKHGLLELAKQATADRGLNYGRPESNFTRIAEHWNAFLANRYGKNNEGETFVTVVLTAEDVALMMALMKLARLENQPAHLDSWIDLAGYAACGAEIALAPKGESDGK